MYIWVNNFLLDRKIQVKVGTEYSNVHGVENGTLQGSVCSPLLFNIMINVFFFLVDQGVGKSLYADDGALFISCRNVFFEEEFKLRKWRDGQNNGDSNCLWQKLR